MDLNQRMIQSKMCEIDEYKLIRLIIALMLRQIYATVRIDKKVEIS